MNDIMSCAVLFLLAVICPVYSNSGVFKILSWGEERAVLLTVTVWVSHVLQGLPVVRIVDTTVHIDIMTLVPCKAEETDPQSSKSNP